MEHFGVRLIDKGKSLRLIREEFAPINTKPSLPYFSSLAEQNAYVDEHGSAYTEAWCESYRLLCLKNYDLTMDYYSRLDKTEFYEALEMFLAKYKRFKEIKDLKECADVEGYYIMVLDEYKQVYIGKTMNIRRRIMQHWSKVKPFDRTLFPMYAWDKSPFSIDFFRALDTTRIFVWKKKISDGIESRLIKAFPSLFCTNRIGGDIIDAIRAIETMNKRSLV